MDAVDRAVCVPAGWFLMGSEDGLPDERPPHRVWVDAFATAAHPVTNREYARFAEATGRRPPPAWDDGRFTDPDQPVVTVSWHDAVAYCAWLSAETGEPWRLPTEAEREKAARGGRAGARFPGGDEVPAWARPQRRIDRPYRVGGTGANGYGLFHMADLVHEWCSDWFAAGYYAVSPERNPQGPERGRRRASRGGSWRHRVKVTRCAARSSIPPDLRYDDYGFRAVRPLGG